MRIDEYGCFGFNQKELIEELKELVSGLENGKYSVCDCSKTVTTRAMHPKEIDISIQVFERGE